MKSISTRLRNKSKNDSSALSTREQSRDSVKVENLPSGVSTQSSDDNLTFSPRTDPDIYLDELQSPLSYVRGSKEDKASFLKEENEKMIQSFGKGFKPGVKISTFYSAQIAAPVPSKRTRHRTSDNSSTSPISSNKTPAIKRIKLVHKSNGQQEASHPNNVTTARKKEAIGSKQSSDKKNDTTVSLPLSKKVPTNASISLKEKEKEYWRRQRRAFVHSRYLSNEEGALVAESVYSDLRIEPTHRMVISFQGNLSNFRTRLRRAMTKLKTTLNITKEMLLYEDEQTLYKHILPQLDQDIIDTIWGHWITEPFVDTKTFYADKESVKLLKDITIKLMIIFLKEQLHILSQSESRIEMKKVDLLTRAMILPDRTEFA